MGTNTASGGAAQAHAPDHFGTFVSDRENCKLVRAVEAIRFFGDYTDRTQAFHDRVLAALEGNGWQCRREVAVQFSPNRNDGRIDIVATWGNTVMAVECDNRSPRQRSLLKLAAFDCDVRLVVLRRQQSIAYINNIAVIGVEVQSWP